jgi:hypothetical protein
MVPIHPNLQINGYEILITLDANETIVCMYKKLIIKVNLFRELFEGYNRYPILAEH